MFFKNVIINDRFFFFLPVQKLIKNKINYLFVYHRFFYKYTCIINALYNRIAKIYVIITLLSKRVTKITFYILYCTSNARLNCII